MNIRAKMLVLLFLILSLFMIGVIIQYNMEKKGLALLIQKEQRDNEIIIDKLLVLKGQSLETFVFDYTFWDDMVDFVTNSQNNPWASHEVDEPVLLTYKMNAVWIYTINRTMAYFVSNLNDANMREVPIPKEAFIKLFAKNRFCHFFANTSNGLLEIRGATIHPSSDAERKTPPRGYLFAGRLLDKKFIAELSELTGGKIEIALNLNKSNEASSKKEGIINFTKMLKTWNGNPIGYIDIQLESSLLPIIRNIFNNELILFTIFSAMFAIFVLIALSVYITNPMQLISNSLRMKDPVYINKLQKARNEFGDMARLILEFFSINMKLQREIIEHRKSEEDKHKLEEQLSRQERMESLGRLAGGVAHDLNNILTGIVTYPDYLLWIIPDNPENRKIRDIALNIKDSGERAAALVSELLTLARSGAVEKKSLSLNKIVEDYTKSLEYKELLSRYPRVTVEILLGKDLFNISGVQHMLHKTLMNLVINAMEAMPNGGKITIITENRYLDKPISGYDNIQEGDYVVLGISDQGTGISQEDLKRIFEPFYTKKAMGRSGTGLGLSVVWNTIQAHNGYINVQSSENIGTTFELYFPITREEIEQQVEVSLDQYKGNNEKILVIDDILEQRTLASTLLENLGYNVNTVASGEEAVEYVKQNPVDLLILDMIMDPGIDGYETYKRIVKIRPTRAIIASGYAETERVKETQKLGAGLFVKKPYTLRNIGLAVHTELRK